jgi:hypothetical protein
MTKTEACRLLRDCGGFGGLGSGATAMRAHCNQLWGWLLIGGWAALILYVLWQVYALWQVSR